MATAAPAAPIDWSGVVRRHWPLLVGMLLVCGPTLVSIARGPWSLESGVHGPIVLATGIWLVVRKFDMIQAEAVPGDWRLTTLGMAVAVPVYAFGRAFDFISIEVAAMLLALLTVGYALVGGRVLRQMWFPIFYFGFVIPVPGWIIQPLKQLVSQVVTEVLADFGYPIARVGVTIYVATYQLLVEDACAGLNSLISLSAMSLGRSTACSRSSMQTFR